MHLIPLAAGYDNTCECCEGFSGGASAKDPACQCRRFKRCGFGPWVRKISWSGVEAWQPTPVCLPGKSHGQELGGLQSMGPQRVGHDQSDLAHMHAHECCLPAKLIEGFYFYD